MVEEQLKRGFSDKLDCTHFQSELLEFLNWQNRVLIPDSEQELLGGVDFREIGTDKLQKPQKRRGRKPAAAKSENTAARERDKPRTQFFDEKCELVTYSLKGHESRSGIHQAVDAPARTISEGREDMEDPVSLQEIVIQLSIYDALKPRKRKELLVLGTQTLDILKRNVPCFVSSLDADAGNTSGREGDAFLFIENTFYGYGDRSDLSILAKSFLDSEQYSWKAKPRRDTIASRSRRKSSAREDIFNAAPSQNYDYLSLKQMRSSTFNTLRFRIGFPYVFVHAGGCEHLVVFRDLRSFNPTGDSPSRADYPRCLYELVPTTQKCTVCTEAPAQKYVVGDEHAEESPALFCEGVPFNSFSRPPSTSSDY